MDLELKRLVPMTHLRYNDVNINLSYAYGSTVYVKVELTLKNKKTVVEAEAALRSAPASVVMWLICSPHRR